MDAIDTILKVAEDDIAFKLAIAVRIIFEITRWVDGTPTTEVTPVTIW